MSLRGKKMKYEKMNNLFLRQSYLDSWEDYERSLKKKSFIKWDYIILTASNEAQAMAYRNQIENRLEKGLLPEETTYAVPRELPDGRSSTLFDEFIVGMSGVPSRIQEGMLVLSGDVLLLFNPLQIDAQFDGAAAISIKEPVATGKNHGVFLNDGHDYVKCFLHKQTEERLREMGAVNNAGNVDLDTGAVLFGSALLQALFRLISTEGKVDEKKFRQFCNEEARISFYGDFLYPLANDSTLEDFYKEAAEGQLNEALHECRTQIWNAIHHFSMKLLCLSPAEFIHFGTTRELRSLVTKDVQDYEFLDWKMQVNSAVQKEGFAAHNAYVGSRAKIGKEAYLENCYVLGNSEVGDGTVLSHVRIMDRKIPEQIVMHGIELTGGKKVIRIYGVPDNPKGKYPGEVSFLGTTLNQFMAQNKVTKEELWKGEETYLWFADLYPVCDDWEDALDMAEIIYKMAHGTATKEEISRWRETERRSLYSSFNAADIEASCDQERFLENRILARCFIRKLEQGMYYAEALKIFGKRGISKEIFKLLMEDAAEADFSLKIRIYHAVSCYMKKTRTIYDDLHYDALENDCFGTIQEAIYEEAEKKLPDSAGYRIVKDQVDIALPVRVNWTGAEAGRIHHHIVMKRVE